ncbi:phosphate transporter 2 [Striga asiatica]|uniref:Phosphate transporter 2 n=1 Tax=Striga asiatica TaxID=4170 RepID=A0A5A7QPL4_STRAF|nr:phosphate transporter 2 [Striga asiatica]
MEVGNEDRSMAEAHLGNKKAALWYLASLSSFFAVCVFILRIFVKHHMWSKDDKDTVRVVLYYSTFLYVIFVTLITVIRESREKKWHVGRLGRWSKKVADVLLVLMGLGISYYARGDALWVSLVQGLVPINVMATFNLFGDFVNFGFRDCCLVVLVDAALALSFRYPMWAPFIVAIVSLAFQAVKEYGDIPLNRPPHPDHHSHSESGQEAC